MESEWTLFWITGIIILGFVAFFLVAKEGHNLLNNSSINNQTLHLNFSVDEFSQSSMIHWTHMPLSYSISQSCSPYQQGRILLALNYIHNETLGYVSFISKLDASDIAFNCLNDSSPSKGYYRGGQAKFRSYDGKIFSAEINLYNESRDSRSCGSFMDTEIHEILHILGYSHSDNPMSIMSAVSIGQCDVLDVEPQIIQELIFTYKK